MAKAPRPAAPRGHETATDGALKSAIDRVIGRLPRLQASVVGVQEERKAEIRVRLDGFLAQPGALESSMRTAVEFLGEVEPATCAVLIQASYTRRHEDPVVSHYVARLAAHCASAVVTDSAVSQQTAGSAFSELGRSCTAVGDFAGAEDAFRQADFHFGAGTGEPYDELRYWERLSILRNYQGRYLEAATLIRRAAQIAHDIGDRHIEGQDHVTLASYLLEADRTEEAVVALRRAATLVDPGRDPRIVLALHHTMARCLLESGRVSDAAAIVPLLESQVTQFGTAADRRDVTWLAGRIALERGEAGVAASRFEAVREMVLGRGEPLEVGLVTLELAVVRALEWDLESSVRLATEAAMLLEALGLSLEADAARLIVLDQRALHAQLAAAVTAARRAIGRS